jgi:hypothetical protein
MPLHMVLPRAGWYGLHVCPPGAVLVFVHRGSQFPSQSGIQGGAVQHNTLDLWESEAAAGPQLKPTFSCMIAAMGGAGTDLS